jgi:hypothetical protein
MLKMKLGNDIAVIYHHHSQHKLVGEDLTNPIVFSIASFRKYEPHANIYVHSNSYHEWGKYPDLLNFKVIEREPKKLDYSEANEFPGRTNYSSITLSQVFDVHDLATEVKESKILYSDSDVFWIKKPFPLMYEEHMDKMCMCSSNTGLYYFNKESKATQGFYKMWKGLILNACEDISLREKLKCNNEHRLFTDESAARHLQSVQNLTEYKKVITNHENFFLHVKSLEKFKQEEIKAIHLQFGKWGPQRGAACQAFADLDIKINGFPKFGRPPIWIKDLKIPPEEYFKMNLISSNS